VTKKTFRLGNGVGGGNHPNFVKREIVIKNIFFVDTIRNNRGSGNVHKISLKERGEPLS
jgi:hypothetical protein